VVVGESDNDADVVLLETYVACMEASKGQGDDDKEDP